MKECRPIDYIQNLLRQGRYSFSGEEAGKSLNQKGKCLSQTLKRLSDKGWVKSFSKGFYLALDVQHQSSGLDPKWFIDDWAGFVGAEYYVSGLSAAALHGAGHQRPMSFRVVADRQFRSIRKPRLQVDIFYKKSVDQRMWMQMKSPAGYFRVGTSEITAYDIVRYKDICPSLDLAATVLVELGEVLSMSELMKLPELGCELASLQRLGWLLDKVGWSQQAEGLAVSLQGKRLVWRSLDTRLPEKGERNNRWHIIENTDVQSDIEK
jgi:predicted transcriptional regulator of viral defense system